MLYKSIYTIYFTKFFQKLLKIFQYLLFSTILRKCKDKNKTISKKELFLRKTHPRTISHCQYTVMWGRKERYKVKVENCVFILNESLRIHLNNEGHLMTLTGFSKNETKHYNLLNDWFGTMRLLPQSLR